MAGDGQYLIAFSTIGRPDKSDQVFSSPPAREGVYSSIEPRVINPSPPAPVETRAHVSYNTINTGRDYSTIPADTPGPLHYGTVPAHGRSQRNGTGLAHEHSRVTSGYSTTGRLYYPDVPSHHTSPLQQVPLDQPYYHTTHTHIAESISPSTPGQQYPSLTDNYPTSSQTLDYNANQRYNKNEYASSNIKTYSPEPFHNYATTPRVATFGGLGEHAESIAPVVDNHEPVTLFRTTIPIMADNPPSAKHVTTENALAPPAGQPTSITKRQNLASEVIPEEELDYETVTVTNNETTSAIVHSPETPNDENQTSQGTSIVTTAVVEVNSETKTEKEEVNYNPETANKVELRNHSAATDDLERIIEKESPYARREDIKQRKSQRISENIDIMAAVGAASIENGDNEHQDADDGTYSEVIKVKATEPNTNTVEHDVSTSSNADDTENPYEGPPIPLKTDEAYLPQEDDNTMEGTSGNVLDKIHNDADKVRNTKDYYADVDLDETRGAAAAARIPAVKVLAGGDEDDDYATVELPSPLASGGQQKNIVKVNDDEDYASVEIGPAAGEVTLKSNSKADEEDYATVDISQSPPISPAAGASQNGILNPTFFTQTPGATAPVPPKKTHGSHGSSASAPQPLDMELPKAYSVGRMFNVYILEADITQLRVDALVNPVNSKLKHTEGASALIAKVGGKDLEKDAKKMLKKIKQLDVASAVTTNAGKLASRKVIHTHGPKWSDYRESGSARAHLMTTFKNIWKTCASEGAKTVALPPISTGSSGAPHDKVAECLHQAILDMIDDFSSLSPPGRLYIVDSQPNFLFSMVEQMHAGKVTSAGSNVIVEEIPRESARNDIAEVLPASSDGKKHKKVQKTPSTNRIFGRGKLSRESPADGQNETTKL